MNRIALSIKRGRGGVWGLARGLTRAALSFHIPVAGITKPAFGALYSLHVLVREALAWMLRFCWYEPLFRSQCDSVGENFRMERLPYITGRGHIRIGIAVRLSGKSGFGFSNCLDADPSVEIGDGTFIGHACSFAAAGSVRIGRHCLLASGVSIRDWDGHAIDARRRRTGEPIHASEIRPVVIEDEVWIGTGAMILKGVRIGARSIVGAGAVVSRDVPPDSVVAGNPAKIVKSLAAPDTSREAA